MIITIITSNNLRHNYLIKEISKISKQVFVIQECKPILGGINNNFYKKSKIIYNYFKKVETAQNKIFKDSKSNYLNLKNVNFGKKKIFSIITLGDPEKREKCRMEAKKKN